MKLIDAEQAEKVLSEYYHLKTDTQHRALREALNAVPYTDAEPVVRCYECRHIEYEDGLVWKCGRTNTPTGGIDGKTIVNSLPTVDAEPHWIPCSERMPEKDGYYLTTTCYRQVYCDFWNEDHFDRTEAVIAWMPLPKPYEVEDEKTDYYHHHTSAQHLALQEALNKVPTVDAVPVSELKDTEKERDYWRDMAHSYEQTILRLTISASDTTAEPVRHGKWIDETFEPWGLVHHPYKCNLCGEHAEFASPYCPNCGARMDDGNRNE